MRRRTRRCNDAGRVRLDVAQRVSVEGCIRRKRLADGWRLFIVAIPVVDEIPAIDTILAIDAIPVINVEMWCIDC